MSRSGRAAASPPLRLQEVRDKERFSSPLKEKDKEKDRGDGKDKDETKDGDGKKDRRDSKEDRKEKERVPASSSASSAAADDEEQLRSARLQRVESSRMRALVSDAGQIVKLNVGGTRYYTTNGTLLGTHIGLITPTFFHGMLAGRVPAATDSEGFIFIDRNGPYFEPVLDFMRKGEWHVSSQLDEKIALKEAAFYGLEPKGSLNDDMIVEMIQKRAQRKTRELMDLNRDKVQRICDHIATQFKRTAEKGEALITSPVFLPDDPKKLIVDHISQYWKGHRFHSQAVQHTEKLTRQLTDLLSLTKYVFDTQLHTILLRGSEDVRLHLQHEYRLTTEVKEIVYYLQSVGDDTETFNASVKTYRDPICAVQSDDFSLYRTLKALGPAIDPIGRTMTGEANSVAQDPLPV